MTYPNSQSTSFSYFNTAGDQRLQEIENLKPSSTVLSKFDYPYNPSGSIATSARQNDSSDLNLPYTYTFQYDNADQLLSAVLRDSSSAALHQHTSMVLVPGDTFTEGPNVIPQPWLVGLQP